MSVLEQIRADGCKVVEKTGWFWSALHWAIVVLSFGRNRRFLMNYYTTIGPVIGIPKGLSPENADESTLMHEWEHVKQCRDFGCGNAWVGLPLFGLLYCLLPLPFGLAWFRYYFERKAYRIGIDYRLINAKQMLPSGKAKLREDLIKHAVEQLTGPDYIWTWPFKKSVTRWFEKNCWTPIKGAL